MLDQFKFVRGSIGLLRFQKRAWFGKIAWGVAVFLTPAMLMHPSHADEDLPELSSNPQSVNGAIQLVASVVRVKPNAWGGEAGMALLLQPLDGVPWYFGPKATALLARGDGRTRFDLNSGLETTFWFANAIGIGGSAEVVAPSSISFENLSTHFRFSPQWTVRLARLGDDGAWAVRLAVPYDTHFGWGVSLGCVLQMGQIAVSSR